MIKFRFFIILLCSFIFSASAATYYFNSTDRFKDPQKIVVSPQQQAVEKAKNIVVQIKVSNTSGSGIIIEKTNNIYKIITNRHVIDRGDKYQIQTLDNHIHKGSLVAVSQQDDLAILKFTSDRIYPTAAINTAPLDLSHSLFAVGFPFNSDRLQVTSGKLLLETIKPLKQGYQLGYTNNIRQGMSGGAILNSAGEVVGVNGRSANPIILDYQFQDGTHPNEELQQQMMALSWGIPIQKAIELLSTVENN